MEKLDVLDLIIDILITHEMMLDAMIGRLEGLCYDFEASTSGDDARSSDENEKIVEPPIEMI